MIHPITSPQDISQAIERIEQNLKCITGKEYVPKERRDLREIYKGQLIRYKQKQLSFYSARLK